jgi:hypothetical protein
VPGRFAQVGGGVCGFEGAKVVGPGISQILSFPMILAKLSKIKLLLLLGLKFLSSLSEKLLVYFVYEKYIYICTLQKVRKRTPRETKTCTEM